MSPVRRHGAPVETREVATCETNCRFGSELHFEGIVVKWRIKTFWAIAPTKPSFEVTIGRTFYPWT